MPETGAAKTHTTVNVRPIGQRLLNAFGGPRNAAAAADQLKAAQAADGKTFLARVFRAGDGHVVASVVRKGDTLGDGYRAGLHAAFGAAPVTEMFSCERGPHVMEAAVVLGSTSYSVTVYEVGPFVPLFGSADLILALVAGSGEGDHA